MADASAFEATLQAAWRRRGALACVLWPVSLLYRLVTATRRWLYAIGWFSSESVAVPVLVVGNLVAGGAGKTPVVLALVRRAQARGIAVGVVSRGHGRRLTRHLPDLREVGGESDASLVGDEPLLIQSLTGAPVFVARDRVAAARALCKRHPQTRLIVSDDGLQHLALRRDAEICVLGADGVGNGWLLPAGPLREAGRSVTWVLDAGMAVGVLPTPVAGLSARRGHYSCRRSLAQHAQDSSGRRVALASLVGQPVWVVAGIAHPQRFFSMLSALGVRLAGTDALPDHAAFDQYVSGAAPDMPLLCTEKDAVKLWRLRPDALAVPLELDIDPAFFRSFEEWLVETIGG